MKIIQITEVLELKNCIIQYYYLKGTVEVYDDGKIVGYLTIEDFKNLEKSNEIEPSGLSSYNFKYQPYRVAPG